MPRFLTGDELGNIKSIHCSKDPQSDKRWKLEERILFSPSTHAQIASGQLEAETAKRSAVQRLSILRGSENTLLAAARSNGALSTLVMSPEDSKLELFREWKDPRFKPGHMFVGLDLSKKGLFWCTSNGALGFSGVNPDGYESGLSSSFQKASLPMRLRAWRLSPDYSSFAYGGDEVDVSVWETDRAFQGNAAASTTETDSKKRKRGNELFPGEIWRAKNLPNDHLGLRQPIHVTSLSFLSSNGSSTNNVHLVTGNENGDVRRYDTRAARRPIANWTGVGKIGGVGIVQEGFSENELLVADNGTLLSSLDLRNGRTIYSYKKLQGAITSLAPSHGGLLGSTSHDRFFRLHTTFPPPETAGHHQEDRGEVIDTVYMKSVPTAVVLDESDQSSGLAGDSKETEGREDGSDEEDEDVWANMENAGDSDDENPKRRKSRRQP